MSNEIAEIISDIRSAVKEFTDASMADDVDALGDDELIPATGLLDSAGLIELMLWYQDHFKIPVSQDELTIDNFGTLVLMANFVLARKQA